MKHPTNGRDPRVFETGVVYIALTPSYVTKKMEEIRLVLGPSSWEPNDRWSIHPHEYRYLCLITGEVGNFHRNSYFAEQAEPL